MLGQPAKLEFFPRCPRLAPLRELPIERSYFACANSCQPSDGRLKGGSGFGGR
jgi:hypothetical protein